MFGHPPGLALYFKCGEGHGNGRWTLCLLWSEPYPLSGYHPVRLVHWTTKGGNLRSRLIALLAEARLPSKAALAGAPSERTLDRNPRGHASQALWTCAAGHTLSLPSRRD